MQPQNPQDSSLFFQKLPPEIRLEIYSHVFYSTRLSFGRRLTNLDLAGFAHAECVRLLPAPNSLSLLRVCRRVNGEIGHSWLGQTLFSFEDAETMWNKFGAMEPSTLAKLRHMRISGCPPILSHRSDFDTKKFGWAHMLKLLPGLCLDRLTVIGHHNSSVNFPVLDGLIKHSDGWKELYYLSHKSAMRWPDDILGASQMLTWESELASRDGPTSSVTIYQSSHVAEHGVMISKPATREAFADQPADPGEEQAAEEDVGLMELDENEEELLVVARRGKGVDCAVKPWSPPLPDDIWELHAMPWKQICYEAIKVDTYKHVDDYEWTPLHFVRD